MFVAQLFVLTRLDILNLFFSEELFKGEVDLYKRLKHLLLDHFYKYDH
jgi:hypothetical protein